jgi:hypothetical protein
MLTVCPEAAIAAKYGAKAEAVLAAVHALGNVAIVDGHTTEDIRQQLLGTQGPICLIGGYDLIPAFVRPNPTRGNGDDDVQVPTDAPFGVSDPGDASQEYAPERAVSRIPDPMPADAAGFVRLLASQQSAASQATPALAFQEAASEFAGALSFVAREVPGMTGLPTLSPPAKLTDGGDHGLPPGIGRIHVLLHGADADPDWGVLWGHAKTGDFFPALAANSFRNSNLTGAVVSFSSCYSAMLDVPPQGGRNSTNQVAMACLAAGAKVVFGASRSNWISTSPPFDGFGPGLMALVWRRLAAGVPAAEALRLAKYDYLKVALGGHPGDRPYALKTVLQAHCYGRADATL